MGGSSSISHNPNADPRQAQTDPCQPERRPPTAHVQGASRIRGTDLTATRTFDSPGSRAPSRARSRGSADGAPAGAMAAWAVRREQRGGERCSLRTGARRAHGFFITAGHGGPRGGAAFPETSSLPLLNEGSGISGLRECPARAGGPASLAVAGSEFPN